MKSVRSFIAKYIGFIASQNDIFKCPRCHI